MRQATGRGMAPVGPQAAIQTPRAVLQIIASLRRLDASRRGRWISSPQAPHRPAFGPFLRSAAAPFHLIDPGAPPHPAPPRQRYLDAGRRGLRPGPTAAYGGLWPSPSLRHAGRSRHSHTGRHRRGACASLLCCFAAFYGREEPAGPPQPQRQPLPCARRFRFVCRSDNFRTHSNKGK